jgi:hypothetical protein
MLSISMTRFARFCAATSATRAVAARDGITGNDGQDVYLPLKQAVREVVGGGDKGAFDRLIRRMEGSRLSEYLPAVLPPLRKFLERSEMLGPGVIHYLPIAPRVNVRVNPELRLVAGGKLYHVKLWFRMDPPEDELVEAITSLIYAANSIPKAIPAVLDVRRMRLRTGASKRDDHTRVVMADGAAFASLIEYKRQLPLTTQSMTA